MYLCPGCATPMQGQWNEERYIKEGVLPFLCRRCLGQPEVEANAPKHGKYGVTYKPQHQLHEQRIVGGKRYTA